MFGDDQNWLRIVYNGGIYNQNGNLGNYLHNVPEESHFRAACGGAQLVIWMLGESPRSTVVLFHF
jgi:hypothetical protein